MRNATVILVVLLLVMTAAVTAVVSKVDAEGSIGLGLAVGQIVLASAAVIFLRQRLWLRLTVLLLVIFASCWLVAASELQVVVLSLFHLDVQRFHLGIQGLEIAIFGSEAGM